MNSFLSSTANCLVRWHDFPGTGAPVLFVHGLGCASSYEYPRVVTDPFSVAEGPFSLIYPAVDIAKSLGIIVTQFLIRLAW
ncbi:hypothetical protein GCM10011328_09130 [Hafnia psychrotolerans]|uniref:Alpha/beta hydrolase n=1 Tax=Hafnia psychrotolerans TaxID=1477018 RepID=A0ABQ1G5P5_9GAMM|nr:hypothetical protein GCM10011328_09130 [Hafnia psychrotolerans]